MITDIAVNNKYVLIYDGLDLKSGTLTTGKVTSPFTVEVFATAQQIVDRGLALGLTTDTEYCLTVMEHGAILPQANMDVLKTIVSKMDVGHKVRMVLLGHATPNEAGIPPQITLPPHAQVPENPGPP